MTVLIEDSPRPYQVRWIAEVVAAGSCGGAIITPWATPWNRSTGSGQKPSARDRVPDLQSNGVDVWFDATTHALQMSGVGDFRYYDQYDLWGGARGDLTTPATRDEHVQKVFDLQDQLGVQRLGPTVLLHTGLSTTSTIALELARAAVALDPDCWLSLAGTPSFWASQSALDAHVGALAGLEPAGWFVTVVRPLPGVPASVEVEEVHGLARTCRALSEDAPIHVSHGDLAALPAVAAGATTVGSGWDQRQRVCSYADYAPRTTGGGGGAWYERPTLSGLVGSLSKNEADILRARDSASAARLGGLPAAPGPKEAFLHHVDALNSLVARVASGVNYEDRYRTLVDLYDAATSEWPGIVRTTNCDLGSSDWIANLHAGLMRYGATEGW